MEKIPISEIAKRTLQFCSSEEKELQSLSSEDELLKFPTNNAAEACVEYG